MTHVQTTVKERPILFNGAMVRALLAGAKTQTRRAVKCPSKHLADIWQDGQGHFDIQPCFNKPGYEMWDWEYDTCRQTPLVCPYGQPGDRLWVRETFASGFYVNSDGELTDELLTIYRATDEDVQWYDGGDDCPVKTPWIPSIHMPRAASRLLLEITAVRVERVQDISEADAVAEGIETMEVLGGKPFYRDYLRTYQTLGRPQSAYESLWASLNGPESWAANPWVWVVEFKAIDGKEATRA